MDATVNYGIGTPLKNNITIPTALSSTETDLFTVVQQSDLKFSQLTVYGSVTLGAVTSANFYYYYSPDNGTTWFPISLYNTSNGEITQRTVVVDSGTYATGGVSLFADNVPLGATTAIKVTGKSSSGTPAFTLNIIGRNN